MKVSLPKRRPAIFATGLVLGALILLVIPSSWLFRPPLSTDRSAESDGRRYACPMFCTMADRPGECPVCGMDMEPVTDQGSQVILGRRDRYQVGVRTAIAEREPAVHRIRALGKVRYDQRREGQVTAWVSGRLDRLSVDFEGVEVRAGEKVAEIYAPELVAAQEELISARRTRDEAAEAEGKLAADLLRNAENVYRASRRRLTLLGMPESVLDEIEKEGVARDHLDIHANVGGTVVKKRVETGDYVKTGQVLFEVVDLSVVWAMLDVFEQDAGAVFLGQRVEVRIPSLPGEVHHGIVAFVDPLLDERTRVVRVRVNLPNADGRLKPGMFVDAEVLVTLDDEGRVVDPASGARPGSPLLVPLSAVLDGGARKLVYVMKQPPGPMKDGEERWPAIYEPRRVETGLRVDDSIVVLSGLSDGDQVVTRGQFLIDSQLQLTGKPSLMLPEGAGGTSGDPHAGH